jgi:hypothetical protein
VRDILRDACSTEREDWMLYSIMHGRKDGRRSNPQSPLRSRFAQLLDAQLTAASLAPSSGAPFRDALGN